MKALDFKPEIEILIACARTSLDSSQAAQMRVLLDRSVDWQYLTQLAISHRVVPFLYQSLQTTRPGAVPEPVMSLLRELCRNNSQHMLLLTGELLKLLGAFNARGIRAIPLKGPVLAAVAYRNLSLRQIDDLDILFHQHDILKAKSLLIAQGYRPRYQLTPMQEAAFFRSQYDYPLMHSDGNIVVDMHCGIKPRYFAFSMDFEDLWRRSQLITVGGIQLRSLALEDMLLTLCVHGAGHCWPRLAWICDIAELIRKCEPIKWEQLLERAGHLGSRRMLLLGLFLAHDLLNASLPEEVARQAQADRAIKSLIQRIYGQLFDITGGPRIVQATLFHLKARERWRDRARYCLRLAMIPTKEDYDLLAVPSSLAFLYYLLRPFRLVGKYGHLQLRHLLAMRWKGLKRSKPTPQRN